MPSSISSGGVPGSPRLSPAGDRPVPYCRARKRAYPADGAEREAAFSVLQHFILCTPSPGLFLPHTVDKYSTERMETKEAALRRLRHSSTYDIDMAIGTFEG